MATMIVCDGCGCGIDGPPEKKGYVHRCDYCAPCAMVAGEYQAEIDKLHEQLAEVWRTDLEQIRANYRAKLQRLPDDNVTVPRNDRG